MHTLYAHAERCLLTDPNRVLYSLPIKAVPAPLLSHEDPLKLENFARCIGLQDHHIWAVLDGRSGHESAGWRRLRDTALPGSITDRFFKAMAMTGMRQQAALTTADGQRMQATVAASWSQLYDPRTDLRLPVSIECGETRFTLDLRDYFTVSGGRQRNHFRTREAGLVDWWSRRRARSWPASPLDFLCETAGPILDAVLRITTPQKAAIAPDSPHAPVIAAMACHVKSHLLGNMRANVAALCSAEAARDWQVSWVPSSALATTSRMSSENWETIGIYLAGVGVDVDIAQTVPLWPETPAAIVRSQVERVARGETLPLDVQFSQTGGAPYGDNMTSLHLYTHQGEETVVDFAFATAAAAHAAAATLQPQGWAAITGGVCDRRLLIEVGGIAGDPSFRAAVLPDLHLLHAACVDPTLEEGIDGFSLHGSPGCAFDEQGRLVHTETPLIHVGFGSESVALNAAWYTPERRKTGIDRLGRHEPRVCAAYFVNPHRRHEHLYDELVPIARRLEERYGKASATLAADDRRWDQAAERVATLRLASGCDGAPGHGAGCSGATHLTVAVLRLLFPDLDAGASISARGLACDCALG